MPEDGSGRSTLWRRTTSSASANVDGSATVGPEAMTAGSSPGTSEMAKVTTSAGRHAKASRPPVMAERCLRTQLMSSMGAPDASNRRLVCCRSARVRPRAGRVRRAEPPPLREDEHQVLPGKTADRLEDAFRGLRTGRIRKRVAGLDHLDAAAGKSVAIAGHHQTGEGTLPVLLHRSGHGGGSLARSDHHGPTPRRTGKTSRQQLLGRRLQPSPRTVPTGSRPDPSLVPGLS